MNALLVVLATSAFGIEVGWEPLPGGGFEYTIQIEPQLLSVLETGEDEIYSEVPEGIDVRRYRIVVGVGKLRRDSEPLLADDTLPQGNAAAPPTNQPPANSRPKSNQPTPATQQPAASPAGPLFGDSEPEADPLAAPPDRATDPYKTPAAEPSDPYGTPPVAGADRYGTPPVEQRSPSDAGEPELPDAAAPGESQPAQPAATDPWAKWDAAPAETQPPANTGAAITKAPEVDKAPAKLPADSRASGPIEPATFAEGPSPSDAKIDESTTGHEAAKPKLDGEVPSESRPWIPLIAAIVLLGCSLGGNIYLGWIAVDARTRYRNALTKLRGATA